MFLAGLSVGAGLREHGIVYADDFPGPTVTEQIDAALAALPDGKGLVIIPHTLGAGFATAIPAGKTVLDLRDDGQDSNFQIFTSNSPEVAAFSVADNGAIKLIRPTAATERFHVAGITGEAFERFTMTMDGSPNGRARAMLMRWGPGIDDRYLAAGCNLTSISSVGTVSVTNGSAAVVGVGTAFTADMVGQAFVVLSDPARIHRIEAVTDATNLTLTTAWGGATLSGESYNIQTPAFTVDQDLFLEVNNRMLRGRMTTNAPVRLIGVDEADSVNLAAGAFRIFLSDNRGEFLGDFLLAVNNKFLRGKLTGGSTFNLIGWDSSDSCNISGGALRIFASDNRAEFLGAVKVGASFLNLNYNEVAGERSLWTDINRNVITREASDARAGLSVYSIGEVDTLLSLKADAQSPGAHTITLAKITDTGSNGSLTWNAQGVITAFTDPT